MVIKIVVITNVRESRWRTLYPIYSILLYSHQYLFLCSTAPDKRAVKNKSSSCPKLRVWKISGQKYSTFYEKKKIVLPTGGINLNLFEVVLHLEYRRKN